jgi:hypothetical protein
MTQSPKQPLSSKHRIGLVLISVGVIPLIAFFLWFIQIRWSLIDKPISLVPGRVEVEFTPNFAGHYVSGIRVQRRLPFETLQCLLGEKDYIPTSQCNHIPSVLRFTWELNVDGHVVQEGTSEKQLAGSYANDFIEMEFLFFEAKRGQHYRLGLVFTKDGGELAATNPRLEVAVDNWDQGDTAMGFLWLVPFAAICAVPGLVLVVRAKRSM